jgi:hypothetical protein
MPNPLFEIRLLVEQRIRPTLGVKRNNNLSSAVKERRGKYGSPLFSYFPFSPFISSFGLILSGFRHEESKQQGKTFFFK